MKKDKILALMVDDVEDRRKKIAAFVKDKSNSFEDRLQVYVATPSHLYNREPWIYHPQTFEKKYGRPDWFDEHGFSRHEDCDLRSLINYGTDDQGDLAGVFYEDEEKNSTMIKDILDGCVHSFTLDW